MSFWDKVDMEVLEATSETFRIEVDKAFQTFLADGGAKEYSFPTNLNNFERKHIHQKAASYNLVSRSHGKDPNRVITIYKKGAKSNFESFYIDLTPETVRELDKTLQVVGMSPMGAPPLRWTCRDKVFGKLSLGVPPPVTAPRLTPQIAAFRKQLPIYDLRQVIVSKVRKNRVLIVSSETGSGKTTQIPQFIMDDALQRGEPCRILCTQPRRISAVSVAERVSFERGAPLGETVGYHIRLESKVGSNCNLIYCTNGVLVRSLMSGMGALGTLTHVIIDEVHERDKLSDFLLICLRESLRKGAPIKLLLMSATINVEKFQRYFEGAEVLAVPGRLFAIREFFLDDVLELTGYDAVVREKRNFFEGAVGENPLFDEVIMRVLQGGIDNEQNWAQLLQFLLTDMPVNYRHSENGATALMAAVSQDNVDMVEKLCSLGADPHIPSKSGQTALSIAENKHLEEILLILNVTSRPLLPREDLLTNYYKTCADEDINYDLLIRLIYTIHLQYHTGAILVFLPGYDDIMICNDRLLETNIDKNSYRVFFLHGSMNIKEQHEVFKPFPDNVRKIILSTNIAETSLTIDDVVYVVDCGKAKVQTYDSCSGLSSLQTQWISKACVKQRAGRAGRTQSGVCFHLFSRTRYDSFLDERIPEILRVPLEELCLNTKSLADNISIYNFLVMAPDPPSSNTVKTAIENLECLGALDKEERLTPLGEYLSQLTIEPHLGKMLIYSAIFKCLDPILTIVASLAQKDPFQLPPQANLRSFAAEKRKSLTANTYSDHMVYLKAFIKWQDSVKYRKERNFCREFFISPSTMETILKTRSQLLGQLRAAKFVPSNGTSMVALNTNSENWPLVKAVISSGLYPKLAFKKGANFCTRTEKKVLVHNTSPMSKDLPLWLVYDEMVKVRNGHQVRGVTPVTPVTISLMCGIKVTYPMQNYLEIDEWLEFEFPSPHIINLRRLIETIIEKKLLNPTNILSENEELAMIALSKILIYEDRAAKLEIPVGIRQKPRFFELNRALDYVENRGAFGGPSTSGAPNMAPMHPQYENSVFLLIKVKQECSVKIAFDSNKWIFSPQTEKQVMALDNGGMNVYLVYTVQKLNAFYGIAKYLTFDTTRHKTSAAIEWIFKSCVPYKSVSHLRNALNNNRLIYDGLDGQEIEMGAALQLWDLYLGQKRQ
ncbi:3'-5' RNA helicase YTHDC2 isoform X2 [Tribolium castaneum]|nr:PREDICTED: probable ATP-dependent RNA helicase YTHDC2 isoform X2 [Tribolium castaneum]|eukprot:XP_008198758.1 PREDICTED: probable ATP-dependent RNA helicase YTHDC2 isoform X2 [Tribolium castaneum]